jgi:hypothetical protein
MGSKRALAGHLTRIFSAPMLTAIPAAEQPIIYLARSARGRSAPVLETARQLPHLSSHLDFVQRSERGNRLFEIDPIPFQILDDHRI